MARIRTIKPEFPQSESMGRVSRDARLLFIMLWTIVDDEGRTRAASRMLASLLYPYDDDAKIHIVQWLFELEREGCITLYSHDGNAYLQIENWLSHQRIDHPAKSRLPAPVAKPREDSRNLAPDLGPRIGPSTKKDTPAKADVGSPKPALPDWIDKAAWDGFVEMRKRIRAPMTGRAEKLAIAELERLANQGHDPTAVLDQSTRNSWKGLFPIKADTANDKRPSAHDNFASGTVLYLESLAREGGGQGEDSGDADGTRKRLLAP